MLFYESLIIAVIGYFVLRGLSKIYTRFRTNLVIGAACLLVYGTWAVLRFAHAPLRPLVVVLAGTWCFCVLLTIAVGVPWLLARGSGRLLRRFLIDRVVPRRAPEPNTRAQSRREFLATVGLPAVSISLGTVCSAYGGHKLWVAQRTLHIRNWPKALDGFRIGQITDTHIGDFISPAWVANAVAILNDAGVDLQVMTGDLLDDLYYVESSFHALELCQARLGMLCVLGNHEKMHGRLPPMLAAYRARSAAGRIRLLLDESTVLQHNGGSLNVVGVDYPMHVDGSHVLPKEEQLMMMQRSAARAFSPVARNQGLLCLSHHPDFFPFAQQRGAHLTLSGHTHGGQLAIAGRPLFTPYEFNLGHYQRADSHLYVSGGTGHWLPLRYGIPMEVTIITVRSVSG
jgi:predicted MPP superfamily phosphohydrolase